MLYQKCFPLSSFIFPVIFIKWWHLDEREGVKVAFHDSSRRIDSFFKADKFVTEADTQIGPQNFVALIISNDHRRLGINVSVDHFGPPPLYSAADTLTGERELGEQL